MSLSISEAGFSCAEGLCLELLNNAPAGVLVVELENKKILYSNPAICKMLGYSSSEMLNMSLWDIHPSDSMEYVLSEFENHISGEKDLAPVVPFQRKDESIFPAVVSGNMVTLDGIACNMGVVIDLTWHRQKDETYRAFFENSSDAMLIIRDYMFVDCNLATVKMLGYDRKEELLDTHPSVLSPEFQPDGKKSYDKAIEMMEAALEKGAHHFEWNHKKKSGDVFPVDVSLTAIPSDGSIILHTVWRDISKRKESENEVLKMQKLKSVGELAGGIAHDFNNVLVGIFGNISLAKIHLEESHPALPSLAEAEKSMTRAKGLTRQLLTFAKGGAPLKERVEIEELIKDVTSFTLAGSNVKAYFEEPKDLWSAEIDKGQIEQVISNLVINSTQAMPEGGNLYIGLENMELLAHSSPNLNLGNYIKVTLRDEGKGIPKNNLNRIFDPYFSTKQAGSGLGLSTVYSIVNKHNGHIGVSSELGKGTEFTIYLPAINAEDGLDSFGATRSGTADLLKGGRVLVMDDEKSVREATRDILERSGFSVETVRNGSEAIEEYQKSMNSGVPFDVVLMDLTIPGGMGGKEAVEVLLDIDPQAKVVVFSGYSIDPIMADFTSYGFKGRLVKPFKIDELIDELSRVINE